MLSDICASFSMLITDSIPPSDETIKSFSESLDHFASPTSHIQYDTEVIIQLKRILNLSIESGDWSLLQSACSLVVRHYDSGLSIPMGYLVDPLKAIVVLDN